MPRCALGIDFGTNSVRALVVDVASGEVAGSSVSFYTAGDAGVILAANDPHLARQSPSDLLDAMIRAVRAAVAQAPSADILGIGIDATGSSPLPVDDELRPLADREAFADDPDAQIWLWKDHTAHAEAAEITAGARNAGLPHLARCGDAYSSEWYWAKLLRLLRTNPAVAGETAAWVELSDWIPATLTGTLTRNACAAGHKALFARDLGGMPDEAFLADFDPTLPEYVFSEVASSDRASGMLSPEWGERLGMPTGIPVAAGMLDAHAGAVGAGVAPGILVKIVGTSTCDCMVHPGAEPLEIPGVSGIVEGSIVPGMWGIEAGQSAVGDIFAWFSRFVGRPQEELAEEAVKVPPGSNGLLALDWHNGNRCVLGDPRLSGLLVGLTLASTPADVYRALVEATAFGALTIVRRMEEYGVRIDEVVACGGIAEKSPLVMQAYADVLNRPIRIAASGQAPALGAAIMGAVAAGAHPTVFEAQASMVPPSERTFEPSPQSAEAYAAGYRLYGDLHDAFGGVEPRPLGHVMKTLLP